MYPICVTLRNTRGATLIIGILTLVLLSLIGIAATSTSRLEVQIAGNDKMAKEAFYAAEFGVARGEAVLESMLTRFELNEESVAGHYAPGDRPHLQDLLWNSSDSVPMPVSSLPTDFYATSPHYTVAERRFVRDSLTTGIGVPTGVYQFRIAARGRGSNPTAESIIETIYAKRFD